MKNKLHGAFSGLGSAAFWGLDTVLIAIVLGSSLFLNFGSNGALVTTFVHDSASFIVLIFLLIFKKMNRSFWKTLWSKSGLIIVGAALLGGPIGMGSYILSINALGPSMASSLSAIYPIFGVIISIILLKEHIPTRVIIGIMASIFGVALMGFTNESLPHNLLMGSLYGFICIIGWGSEAVIISVAVKENVSPEIALAIRQMTSSLVYSIVVMPAIKGYAIFNSTFITSSTFKIIIFAGIVGTISYLLYYHSIAAVGASKAMALNISYPAWAFVFQLFVSPQFDIRTFIAVFMIVVGTLISSTDKKKLIHEEFVNE